MELTRCLLTFFLMTMILCYTDGSKVTFSNLNPKLDINGNIVNAHDGTYQRFGSYWYYHGVAYGLCKEPPRRGCDQTPDHCGFKNNHNVSIWRSTNLSSGSWEFIGLAAQCQLIPGCKILYRPNLVYNPTTKLYVLFVNYVTYGYSSTISPNDTNASNIKKNNIHNYRNSKSNGYAGYAVLTSPSPEGPFKLTNPQVNITRLCPGPVAKPPCGKAQGGAGDYTLFVDDDGTGYLVYSAQYYMSIEQLTPDFLWSTGHNGTWQNGPFSNSVAPDYFVEAPVMFKRKGIYYILYGHCCCFCYQGSGILVLTASSPMGPWNKQTGGDRACLSEDVDVPGYMILGHGACRDSSGVEPLHYERPDIPTEEECGGYCNYRECRGFSFCTDKCPGSCNLYVTSAVAPSGAGWTLVNSTGNATDITRVTNETWWRCYKKSISNNPKIMRLNAEPTPGQGCLYTGTKVSTTHAQQNFVITVPTTNGGIIYIWTGDRWQQAPDGIKGHEGQFWAPLSFDANGILLNVTWINSFTIDMI